MMAFQQTVFAINVLLALVFGVDYFVVEHSRAAPRTKARVGVLLALLFLAYLALLLPFAALGVLLRGDALSPFLVVYAIIPFAIGRLVSYRTLGFYAALQFLTFLLSAATLCVM